MIYLGADHKGFHLKEKIKKYLEEKGFDYEDLGNHYYDELDDFPDFGNLVAQEIAKEPKEHRGILICGSGVGMDIVANRYKGVRSVLAFNPEIAAVSKKDDDTNILSLGADFVGERKAEEIIEAWLSANFSGEEKRIRRIQKIDKVS